MMPYTIPPTTAGKRLDALLGELYPQASKSAIKALFAADAVTCNNKKAAKGLKVQAGDVIHTSPPAIDAPAIVLPNPAIPLSIVYEDAWIIALNKPAGMACHPIKPTETETLANGLCAYAPQCREVGDHPLMCGILHRIDGDTSGLVIAAKDQDTYQFLRAQFANHTIEKHYKALVCATVKQAGLLVNELAHHPNCPGRIVDATIWKDTKRPMHAETAFKPIQYITLPTDTPATLLDITIYTGVTHQIRAQLSFAGLPILGDKRYGGNKLRGFDRHFLHAHTLGFVHPHKEGRCTIKAPLLPELTTLLNG